MRKNGLVYICEKCGKGIYDGEEALIFDGHKLCEECVEDMSNKELLIFVDMPMRAVEIEELLDI